MCHADSRDRICYNSKQRFSSVLNSGMSHESWLRSVVILLWERRKVSDLVDFRSLFSCGLSIRFALVDFRFALQTEVAVSFPFYLSYIFKL